MKWFECVPNFSEGRDAGVIEAIAASARAVPGVHVLDVESNADHHRCVISLAGEGPALAAAILAMARVAVARIDLTRHRGEHPRIGALDVVPFVPLGEATMEDAVALAGEVGARLARELELPVFLYGEAARRPERRDLARVREGEFEGLSQVIGADPKRAPDFGPARLHPTAGAVAVGARPVLIAYNAYLATADVAVAKKVARAVRARDGGLAEVKALGFEIKERARAQVSMNLTDYRRTPIHRALELVRREAARYGVAVEESEIVGLVPEEALLDSAEYYLQLNRFDRHALLERRLTPPATGADPSLAAATVAGFLGRLAARTPTPGGGSASALAGALGAALVEMVVRFSQPADSPVAELTALLDGAGAARGRLTRLIDADAESFEAVRAARRRRKESPADPEAERAVVAALRVSAEVPLESARVAHELRQRLAESRPRLKAALASDATTADALLAAAVAGALANARINLEALAERGAELGTLREQVARLERAAPR